MFVYRAAPVGEGHDPPGSTQIQIVPCFGEFEPNSLRIRPKWLEIPGACRREGHDPPLRVQCYKFPFAGLNGTIDVILRAG